jgi:outer membrane protein
MRSILVGLVVITLAPAASAQESAPKVLSFQEVLERVRANNASLLAARAEIAVAEGELDRAWSGLKPKLNAAGTLTLNSVEQKLDPAVFLPPGSTIMVGEPIIIQQHVQLSGVLSLSQTLFDLSVLRSPGAARAARAAVMARADATEDDLLFQAATLYATAGGLRAQEAAAERAIAVAEQRVKDARVQLEAGTATKLIYTRAETDRVVAEGQKTSFLARRRGTLANLRAMTGSEELIDVAEARLPDLAGKTGEGIEARATVIAQQRAVEAADRAIGLWDMRWVPQLNAEGRALYTNTEGFGDNVTYTAIINLVFPLYDGGLRYAETDIAQARASSARHLLERERLAARAYLEEALANLDSAKAELLQAEAQLKLANETVKQTEDLLSQGLATNLELTDADSRRFTADRAVAQKQLEYDLAALRAYYASGGRLLERAAAPAASAN